MTASAVASKACSGRSSERAASNEDDRRGYRHDAEIEIQLGDVVEHVAKHLAQLVVGLAHDAVRAEEIRKRPPAHELRDHHERAGTENDSVQPSEWPEPGAHSFAAEHCEEQRRGEKRRDEYHGLHARRCGDADREQKRDLPRRGRRLEDEDEEERGHEEHGVERVLRHDRARVDERGKRDREHRGEEREPLADDATGDEVRGDRGQGHDERVQRLHCRVGVGQPLEDRVRRADERRVDDAVAGGRNVAHEQLAAVGDAAARAPSR